jgi:hypothetical protein
MVVRSRERELQRAVWARHRAVIKSGKMVFNIFGEPQFTVLHNGVGQPAIQFYFGLNIQSVG